MPVDDNAREDPHEDPALTTLIRSHATRHAVPPDLADRIRQQIETASIPSHRATRAKTLGVRWSRWVQAVALFAAGAATAAVIAIGVQVAPRHDAIVDELTASHVRSLMASHLDDVASSDHHTVKPWFAGKLDFSPPVHDLSAQGFPLSGGRLDYVGGRPVAALVYKPGLHVINLFVWPAQDGKSVDPRVFEHQGFSFVHWTQGGMQAWAVSDMNAAELKGFAKLVRERMVAPS